MDQVGAVRAAESYVGAASRFVARLGDVGLVDAYRDYVRSQPNGVSVTFGSFFGFGCGDGFVRGLVFEEVQRVGGRLGVTSGVVSDSFDGVAGTVVGGDRVVDAGPVGCGAGVGGGDVKSDSGILRDAGSVASGKLCGSDGRPLGDDDRGGVSDKTLANRAKRARAKARKQRKQGMVEKQECRDDSVPEWRVKRPGAALHRGYFAECSPEVQRRLRESRAEMLVAKNEAEVAKAKMEVTKLELQKKSRVVEKEAEVRRQKVIAELDRFERCEVPQGFAETVVSEGLESVFSFGPVGSGSVSPDSSISVAQGRKLEKMVESLCGQVVQEQKKNEELRVSHAKQVECGVKVTEWEREVADLKGKLSMAQRQLSENAAVSARMRQQQVKAESGSGAKVLSESERRRLNYLEARLAERNEECLVQEGTVNEYKLKVAELEAKLANKSWWK